MAAKLDDLSQLERQIEIEFYDRSLLMRALTHRSYLNENPEVVLEDNERLEFLGDAVIDFVVAAYLYRRYPEMSEGELTMLRAALVRSRTLAGFANDLGVGECLLMGHGEVETGGRRRQPTLCAAFEALVGAIYVDQGLEVVEPWLDKFIGPALDRIIASSSYKDAKSEFQIWAQAKFNITPRYRVLSSEGPDHNKVFTVAVLVDEEIYGVGSGPSKQAAAQLAAASALERVNDSAEDSTPDTVAVDEADV